MAEGENKIYNYIVKMFKKIFRESLKPCLPQSEKITFYQNKLGLHCQKFTNYFHSIKQNKTQ